MLYWSKLKAFADDKLKWYTTTMTKKVFENNLGKAEKCRLPAFPHFPHIF